MTDKEKILKYINENDGVRYSEVWDATYVNPELIGSILQELEDDGAIRVDSVSAFKYYHPLQQKGND